MGFAASSEPALIHQNSSLLLFDFTHPFTAEVTAASTTVTSRFLKGRQVLMTVNVKIAGIAEKVSYGS